LKNAPQSMRSGRAAPEPALAATHNGDAGAGASVSPDEVRACSRQLASGVSVVTTCDAAGRPYGLTMSAVLCVSLDPALFAICIGEESETLGPLLERGAFAINVLGAEQEALARTFASKGGRDKFRRVAYHSSATVQLPVLRGALAVVECSLVAAYPGGDHRLVVGKVEATRLGCGPPLLRYDGRYLGVDAQEYAADRAA
jgi:flavin reductase (DIM6/NTAB) family NADH-FMN oxidoreductase RutF